jgi:hypothetical protein
MFTLTLDQLAQILGLPNHGQCSYTEGISLKSLTSHREEYGPYHTFIPTPNEIIEHIRLPQKVYGTLLDNGHVEFHESHFYALDPLKICVDEVHPHLRRWVEVLRENVFCLPHNHEYHPACCAHMLYCLVTEQPYNHAYFVAKRIVNVKARLDKAIPYGMLLTRLYRYVMNTFPPLQDGQYLHFEPAMAPLTQNTYISLYWKCSSPHIRHEENSITYHEVSSSDDE